MIITILHHGHVSSVLRTKHVTLLEVVTMVTATLTTYPTWKHCLSISAAWDISRLEKLHLYKALGMYLTYENVYIIMYLLYSTWNVYI